MGELCEIINKYKGNDRFTNGKKKKIIEAQKSNNFLEKY